MIFDYPVSVVAGGNATGKSTVLFAAACAYKVPGAGPRDYVPSALFPDFRPKRSERRDRRERVVVRFEYSTPIGRGSMQWKRSKGWNRSFLGRKNARQPERPLYLRTLSNLSNPSEVRGVLSMSRLNAPLHETPLTASQIRFAQQVLPSAIRRWWTSPAAGRTSYSPCRKGGRSTRSSTWRRASERSCGCRRNRPAERRPGADRRDRSGPAPLGAAAAHAPPAAAGPPERPADRSDIPQPRGARFGPAERADLPGSQRRGSRSSSPLVEELEAALQA